MNLALILLAFASASAPMILLFASWERADDEREAAYISYRLRVSRIHGKVNP